MGTVGDGNHKIRFLFEKHTNELRVKFEASTQKICMLALDILMSFLYIFAKNFCMLYTITNNSIFFFCVSMFI